MGTKSSAPAVQHELNFKVTSDPLPVFVPLASLTELVVRSIVSTAAHKFAELDWNHSRRTLLAFLLALNKKLEEIEQSKEIESKFDEHTVQHAEKVRQWLVDKDQSGNIVKLDWNKLETEYQKMINDKTDAKWKRYGGDQETKPYYELTIEVPHSDIEQSRSYMAITRNGGFKPEELKVYWNAEQLEVLAAKIGQQEKELLPSLYDPSDADVVQALRQYPVSQRKHAGKITYVNKGIEKAVFDLPKDAQIIVLNFANETSPGGGYLRHAWAQEEIILYNSDGYRSLLDLKYGRMGGGYAIPEFGLAYVRDICFFNRDTNEQRLADMMVSACYCKSSPQLYDNPDDAEWERNNLAKFRAFIAAAVANTKGDGSNTYLLLGPIGTGAFGNDINDIGHVFYKVLNLQIMGSSGPIRQAFAISSVIHGQTYQSIITLQGSGIDFLAANSIELITTYTDLSTLMSCYKQCNINPRCRTFVSDTTSPVICRLYEGSINTGSIISSSSSTSQVAGIRYDASLYNAYNQVCDLKTPSFDRYLVCINQLWQSPQGTYWSGSMCLNQVYYQDLCSSSVVCRQNIGLYCSACGKCVCNSTAIWNSTFCVQSTCPSSLPIDQTLTALWRLDGDDLMNRYNGTLMGSPSFVPGYVGHAMQGGINTYVMIPHIDFYQRSFTVELWFYPNV